MSDHSTKAAIDLTTKGAESFVSLYYKSLDSTASRHIVPKLYRRHSRVVHNGLPLPAQDEAAFTRYFLGGDGVGGATHSSDASNLPRRSEHEIGCFDCHPLVPGGAGGGVHAGIVDPAADEKVDIIVATSGSVKYDDEHTARGFSQIFTLKRDPASDGGGNYYIDTDCFRLVVRN
ncbi:hypothetical protein PYCC9005_000257 [Savitreella phatthalungensis]